MKTLDLTYASYCNEKIEIAKRNQRARAYSDNVKAKKMHNLKENLIALVTIICVNATVLYTLFDALL